MDEFYAKRLLEMAGRTRKAYARDICGEIIWQGDVPAEKCWDPYGGHWSNFKLADYLGAIVPGAEWAGYAHA